MDRIQEREAQHAAAMVSAKRDALREGLRKWGRTQQSQAQQRDPLVLASLEAGISIEEVHQLMGIGRSTIGRIFAREQPRDTAATEESENKP